MLVMLTELWEIKGGGSEVAIAALPTSGHCLARFHFMLQSGTGVPSRIQSVTLAQMLAGCTSVWLGSNACYSFCKELAKLPSSLFLYSFPCTLMVC